ncbi:MAG: AI-2E family transporter [Nitrospirae bacterium]|nr:AI-2E family transporter [Nitrospirota bacterium]
MAERQSDLTRDTLAVVFLFVLIAASTWILLPFLTAVVWATMIVVATWPLLLMLQRWLLGRRWLAVTVMTLLLLAIFLLPFAFAIGAFIENFKEITTWTTSLSTFTLPPPPDWLGKIPLVGAKAASQWQQLAELSREDLATRLSPYLGGVVRWVAEQVGGLGL